MVLITGSTGFVGGALCDELHARGRSVCCALRANSLQPRNVKSVNIGRVSVDNDWREALEGCKVVVHLAARVHVMNDDAHDPLTVFRAVNVDGTLNLARQAAKAGVRRFVFVSSIKVNGERTTVGVPFKSDNVPYPEDSYGISKYEAEVGLRKIATETGLEVVIVRPPLVYGPGVKGNFSTMMSWLRRGVPLPLGAVTENLRSLVALDNLVDLLVTCIDHPAAANEIFLISDGEDLSTTDLLHRLGVAMGKPARLLPIPPMLLEAAAKLLGKSDMAQRLLGNLQVDISHTCQTLGWKPPISADVGFLRAAQGLDR